MGPAVSGWQRQRPAFEFLEVALAEPVRQRSHMVHMGVTNGNNVRGKAGPDALAHIKDDTKFRDVQSGLFTSHADPRKSVRRQV